MKSISQLRKAVLKAGAALEEDEGRRDMRTFQAIAPENKIWSDGCVCIRIDWACGSTPSALAHNESEFASVCERLGFGLRDMNPQEQELCAND